MKLILYFFSFGMREVINLIHLTAILYEEFLVLRFYDNELNHTALVSTGSSASFAYLKVLKYAFARLTRRHDTANLIHP